MAKTYMRDLVVVLPGIMGSVLHYRGQVIWGQSLGLLGRALISLGSDLDRLTLPGDSLTDDNLGDAITVGGLMPGVHGLHKISVCTGYSPMTDWIEEAFDLMPAVAGAATPANYFPFPYDWRRDNRYTAAKLKQLIDNHLPRWRTANTSNRDAKVILIAHSMGGLIARYYLEVLEGWRDCRALITFGTPYRGAVGALDALSNGVAKLGIDLTPVLRSFTSAYQLLPRYEALRIGDTYYRVGERHDVPGIAAERAADALRFHREIDDAVARRPQAAYPIFPVVGTDQPTLQSAFVEHGQVQVSYHPPDVVRAVYAHGDGTVPRVSATPLELSGQRLETFYPERHAMLHNHQTALALLQHHLGEMQEEGIEAVQGAAPVDEAGLPPALRLELETLYTSAEIIRPVVQVQNSAVPREVLATLSPLDRPGPEQQYALEQTPEGWTRELPSQAPGVYMVRVHTRPMGPSPIHEIVEVV